MPVWLGRRRRAPSPGWRGRVGCSGLTRPGDPKDSARQAEPYQKEEEASGRGLVVVALVDSRRVSERDPLTRQPDANTDTVEQEEQGSSDLADPASDIDAECVHAANYINGRVVSPAAREARRVGARGELTVES